MSLHLHRGTRWAPLLILLAAPLTAQSTSCPEPGALTEGLAGPLVTVRYLADDALEGREVGTPGARCAADYIAGRFEALGLTPGGDPGSFFQTFSIRKGAETGSGNSLTVSGHSYSVGKDWIPFGFSANGTWDLPLVYAGHGLSQPGDEEDRFADIDVDGKIMVVEWGDPVEAHGSGMRDEPHFKATVAAGRGAAGLVVLLPDDGALPTLLGEIRNALTIPVLAVAAPQAEAVRAASKADAQATVAVEVHPSLAEARNVVAVLPGSVPSLRDEFVVVGAHFDHLGWGGDGSLDPDQRAIHNGADDNASGTAGLIEVAERMSEGPPPARSVLFIAFTGEEKGLWGSAHFVASPTVDLTNTVAMLNLDMVGRMVDDGVTVFGTGTASEWESVLHAANAGLAEPLRLAMSPDGYGPSDQASFYGEGIPVLHFFTNTHEDYHRPGDDWNKINANGIDRIARLSARITRRLVGSANTMAMGLTPVKQDRPAPPSQTSSSSRSGYGPYLGTIPDMTPRDFGLRITGVREGSPAEEAGLASGDVIVEFDGKPIADIYAYTYALRDRAPGDEVVIVVERGGDKVTLTAVLTQRR